MLKSMITTLLLFAFSASCLAAQEAKEKLLGKWKADVEKTKQLYKEQGVEVPDEMIARIDGVGFEFLDGGKCRMLERGQGWDGTFELEATDTEGEHALSLAPDGGSGRKLKAIISFHEDGSMTLDPDTMGPLIFVKGEVATGMEINKQEIVGSWLGDLEAAKKINGDKSPEWLNDSLPGMSLTFNENGSFSMTMLVGDDEQQVEGTWKLGEKSEDGKTYAFSAETPQGTMEYAIRFSGDDVLVFQMADNDFVTAFKRKKTDK